MERSVSGKESLALGDSGPSTSSACIISMSSSLSILENNMEVMTMATLSVANSLAICEEH